MHSIFISRVHSVIFSSQLVQRVCVTITSILGQSPFPPHPCFPSNLLGVKIAEHNKQKCRSDVHCRGKQAGNNPVWRSLVGMWRRSCWLSGELHWGVPSLRFTKSGLWTLVLWACFKHISQSDNIHSCSSCWKHYSERQHVENVPFGIFFSSYAIKKDPSN